MAFDGIVGLIEGLILITLFSGFLYFAYFREKKTFTLNGSSHYQSEVEELNAVPNATWSMYFSVILGLAFLIGGSELLVDGGVEIARNIGVSEAVIGLTILAFGTSLPELVASIVAAIRKHADLALGNVVGSNIFNIVGILGIIAVVKPLQIPSRVTSFDMWVMIFSTLIFFIFSYLAQHCYSPFCGCRIPSYLFCIYLYHCKWR